MSFILFWQGFRIIQFICSHAVEIKKTNVFDSDSFPRAEPSEWLPQMSSLCFQCHQNCWNRESLPCNKECEDAQLEVLR